MLHAPFPYVGGRASDPANTHVGKCEAWQPGSSAWTLGSLACALMIILAPVCGCSTAPPCASSYSYAEACSSAHERTPEPMPEHVDRLQNVSHRQASHRRGVCGVSSGAARLFERPRLLRTERRLIVQRRLHRVRGNVFLTGPAELRVFSCTTSKHPVLGLDMGLAEIRASPRQIRAKHPAGCRCEAWKLGSLEA
jgi:hypothetical protein